MIKPGDLHKVWAAPDNTRLAPKQQSFRLPLHVSAKLSALCEMFPEKTRTALVGDLLATALADFERSFPRVKGEYTGYDEPDPGKKLFKDIGPVNRYRDLVNQHYSELERELGNDSPKRLFEGEVFMTVDDEESGRATEKVK
jgi:hypothetical protein